VNFFGLFDIPMIAPKDEGLAGLAGELHEYFAFMLYAAIGLHFLGAAKHHVVDKDLTLRRMGGNFGIIIAGAAFLLVITYFVADKIFFAPAHSPVSEVMASEPASDQVANVAVDSDVWVINPESSYIRFAFKQYGQDVQGEFGEFKGRIVFDPDALEDAQADIMIDTASITTGSDSRDEQAKSGEWFGVEEFPLAVFKTESFAHVEANQYTARGNLTIRGQTMPIVLPFSLDFTEIEDGTQQAVMVSQIALMRLDFGVGQGEWEKEDAIANEVAIDILINASRAP
jgi:cytochrome b561